MSLDALLLNFNSRHITTGTILGPLDVSDFSFVDNLLGGVGAGNFTVKATWESQEVQNLTAGNQVQFYLRLDTNTASIASGTKTITVANGSRFTAGKYIAVYDGVNYDTGSIVSVSGNTVTLDRTINHTYGIGATIMQLRYRGMISAVTQDINLDPTIKVETVSYFSQLLHFVEDNFTGGGMECGWVLYNLLSKHASEIDVVLDTANFVMSSDGSLGTGTTVAYSSKGTNQNTGSLIQDIIKTASQNTAGTAYTLWVDEFAKVHFGPIATAPQGSNPTQTQLNTAASVQPAARVINIDLVNYQNNTGAGNVDGLYDSVGALTRRYQDITNLQNVLKVMGGSSSSGSGSVSVVVENSNSISTYGQFEGTLSNPYITDPNDLANWAKWQVENSAYPAETYNMTLTSSGSFVTSRDIINITGFTDGSNLCFNAFSINTKWDAKSFGQFEQDIQGGDIHPDVTRMMKQIAGQHYVETKNAVDATSNLKDRFVQWGLNLTASGTTATLSQGALGADIVSGGSTSLVEFAINSQAFTTSGDGSYTIAYLYRNLDGTEYASPQLVMYSGTTATNYSGALGSITDYQVVPLWTFTRLGGQILTPFSDRRNLGGVTGLHLVPNPTPGTAPAFTNTPSFAYTNSGQPGYDVTFTVDTTIGQPTWLRDLVFYVVTHGAAAPTATSNVWSKVPANSNGTYSNVTLLGLTSGVQWDIYVAFRDTQGNPSTPSLVGTTAANPQVVTVQNLPAMPNGATITASSVTTTIFDGGMHTLMSGAGKNWIPEMLVGFTLGDSNSPDSTHWGTSWVAYIRSHSASSATDKTTYTRRAPLHVASGSLGNNKAQSVLVGAVTPGQSYDVAVALMDGQGNETPIIQVVSNYAVGTTQLPHCPFPGGYVNTDGSFTNVDGVSSTQVYTITSGGIISATADIAKGVTSSPARIMVGNLTNGYALTFDQSNTVYIEKWVSGVWSGLTSSVSHTADTNYHSFRLTINQGATNTIEASWDGQYMTITDASLNLASGTWPITLYTGGNAGKVLNFNCSITQHHYVGLPNPIKHVIGSNGGNGQLNVAPVGGTTGTLPRNNTHSDFTSTVRSGGGIDMSSSLHVNRVLDYITDVSPNLAPNSDSMSGTAWNIYTNLLSYGTSGPNGATDLEYTGTGVNATGNLYLDVLCNVVMGTTYTPSWWIDPSQIAHGVINLSIQDINSTNSSLPDSTTVDLLNVGVGAAGRYVQPSWTCPVNYALNSDSLANWVLNNLTLGTGGYNGAVDAEVTGTGAAGPNAVFSYNLPIITNNTYTPSIWLDQTYFTGGSTSGVLGVGDITGFGSFGSNKNIAFGSGPARYSGNAVSIPANQCPEPYTSWTLTGSAAASTTTVSNGATYQQVTFSTNADTATSPLIVVTAGQQISLSAQIVGAITAGSVVITAVDQNGTAIPGLSLSQTANSQNRKAQSGFTIPAGVTGMKLVANANGATFTGNVTVKTIQLTFAASDPGGYVSTQDPHVQFFYEAIGPIITSGQKLKIAQPMLEQASSASGLYISSQNPQVRMYAFAWNGQSGGFIVNNGQKLKFSQPMLRSDGVSTPYISSTLTYGKTKATELTSGFVSRLNDGANIRTVGAVAANMDANGNSLLVEFTGGKVQADGSLTNVDFASSATQYTLVSGQPFTISADIAKGGSGMAAIILGNTTNGYLIRQDNAGNQFVSKYVGGAISNVSTNTATTQDTKYHTYRLTIIPGTTNTLEGSIDGAYFSVTDASLNLSSGTWPVTLLTGGSTGKVQHLAVTATTQHHGNMSGAVKTVIDSSSNILSTAFPGGKLQTDGSITNVHNVASRLPIYIANGTTAFAEATIKPGTGNANQQIAFKDASNNGYFCVWQNDNNFVVYRLVGGTQQSMGGIAAHTFGSQDANPHHVRLAVTYGSTQHTIEASIDGVQVPAFTDAVSNGVPLPSSVNVSLGTTNNSGTVREYRQGTGNLLHTSLSPAIIAAINADQSVNIGKPNLAPNPDFSDGTGGGGSGSTGIDGTFNTGTVPKFMWAYNNGSSAFGVNKGETCAFASDNTQSQPVGSTAWKMTVNAAFQNKGLGINPNDNPKDGWSGWTLKANSSYVFSFYAKASVSSATNFGLANDGGLTITALPNYTQNVSDTNWHRYAFLVKTGTTDYTKGLYPFFWATSGPWANGALTNSGALTLTASTTGGTLPTGTRYYRMCVRNANGSTAPGNEANVAVTGPTGSVTISWAAVSGATSYDVYAGTASNGELFLGNTTSTSFTDTGSVTPSGAMPTTNNTNSGTVSCWFAGFKLEEGSILGPWTGAGYQHGVTDFALPHQNKNLDNVGDGSTYARPVGVTGNKITWKSLSGDTSSDTATSLVDSNNKRFVHTAMSQGVQSAVDSSGNQLNVEFSGGKVNSSGELTNVHQASSATHYTLVNGQPFTVSADIAKLVTTGLSGLLLGTTSNGYYVQFYNGGMSLAKVVSGTGSTLGTPITVTNDANYHSFRLTITPGSPNVIEGSIDGNYFSATDSSLNLTSGTWPVVLYTGDATGKVQHYQAGATTQHRGNAHSDFQNTVLSGGGIDFSSPKHTNKNLDNISDGTRKAVTAIDAAGKALIDFNSAHTNQGALSKKNQADLTTDVTNVLPRANIHSSITNAVDASSNLLINGFTGNMSLISSGTYAGLYQLTSTAAESSSGFGLTAGVYVWQEWVAWYPSTSTFGYGPAWYDDSGNFISADTYSTTGTMYYNGTSFASIGTNAANDGNPHNFKFGIAYLSGTNPSAVFSLVLYIDGVQVYSGTYTGNFSGKAHPAFKADGANQVYIRDFACSAGPIPHQQHSPVVTGALGNDGSNPYMTKSQNMVFNGDFSLYTPPTGARSAFASSVRKNDTGLGGSSLIPPNGWTRNFESSGAGEGTLHRVSNSTNSGVSTTDYALQLQDAASGGNSQFAAVCDAFPVIGGKSYNIMADVEPGFGAWASGANWYMRILFYKAGTTDFSRNSSTLCTNNPRIVTYSQQPPSNSLSTATHAGYVDIVNASTSNGSMYHVGGTIAAPSDAAYCRIAFYHWGTTTAAWNLMVSNVTCYESFGSAALLGQSSLMNYTSTPTYAMNGTTTGITAVLNSGSMICSDTSILNFSSGSSSQYGGTAGQLIYATIGINSVTGLPTFALTNFSSGSGANGTLNDGNVSIVINASATIPSSGTTSSTGGGSVGNKQVNSCPADYQLVLTKEHGYIRADEIDIGMHLPSFDGGWNEIHDAQKLPSPIWQFTVERDGVSESFDVNDGHAVKDENGNWLRVCDMKPGDKVLGKNGTLIVTDAHYVGEGHYIALDVETHEFAMGETCAHNATTL